MVFLSGLPLARKTVLQWWSQAELDGRDVFDPGEPTRVCVEVNRMSSQTRYPGEAAEWPWWSAPRMTSTLVQHKSLYGEVRTEHFRLKTEIARLNMALADSRAASIEAVEREKMRAEESRERDRLAWLRAWHVERERKLAPVHRRKTRVSALDSPLNALLEATSICSDPTNAQASCRGILAPRGCPPEGAIPCRPPTSPVFEQTRPPANLLCSSPAPAPPTQSSVLVSLSLNEDDDASGSSDRRPHSSIHAASWRGQACYPCAPDTEDGCNAEYASDFGE